MCYVANGHLHFANVGDSKAFIVTETEVIQVSVDHKASNPDEVVRVEETDGQIINGRINGIIAVTRSFGDSEFKEDGLIAIPYIHEPIPITPDLRCAIIASDGIWDMVNAVELLPLINEPADTIA
jgi:protein phosphatase PTC1